MDSLAAVVVRPARSADTPALRAMELRCFQSDLWRPEDFLAGDCLVAELKGAIVGYLVSHEICPPLAGMVAEREILNLAVDAPYRRLGIAGRLLVAELERGGIHFLEVRKSNHTAQALYRKFGFHEIGQRPGYYQSPVEAAIVMRSLPRTIVAPGGL
jgi:ribosomal-protein-alanine N-acetyltransferase